MISFLTSAKSFIGPSRDPQIRAIRSWFGVAPDVEVILYGNCEGAEEVCDKLGITYEPNVDTSPAGIPLFNAIASHAAAFARHDIQVYVNCDILLTSSLARAVANIAFPAFLMVGQRVDLDRNVCFDITLHDWMSDLRQLASRGNAVLHPPSGKDYFVFTRGIWDGLAPLVIGRAGYDDALLAFCLKRAIPIVDGTFDVVALHQCHDYNHVAGKWQEVWRGPDVRLNERMHPDIVHSAPEVSDAEWTLRRGHMTRTCARGDALRYAELYLRFARRQRTTAYALRGLWRVLRGLRLYSAPNVGLSEVLQGYSQTL